MSDERRPIALLINILTASGAQRRIAEFANRFAALGRAVDVVAIYPGGPMASMLSADVRLVTLAEPGARRRKSSLFFAPALRRYIEAKNPAVLLSCVTDTHSVGVAVKPLLRSRGTPLILRASRNPYRVLPASRWAKRIIEPLKRRKFGLLYARADAIIVSAPDSASGMRRLIPGYDRPIETILHPAITDRLLAYGARPAAFPVADRPLILGIGRLVEQKDFPTLLRACALLGRQRPFRLVLLGKGPDRPALAKLAHKLGIEDSVEMPGEVESTFDWIARADLAVSTSLWEAMQAALIEAMGLGCPVVAVDSPSGARDLLQDGRLGELVPVRDPESLAAAMIRALDHPIDPATLVEGVARFRAEGKAEAYLALFDRLRAKPAPSG